MKPTKVKLKGSKLEPSVIGLIGYGISKELLVTSGLAKQKRRPEVSASLHD